MKHEDSINFLLTLSSFWSFQFETVKNEDVVTETPMLLTNEPATVTNEKDACSLFKTVNTKNEEDIPQGG